jgi:hypothetical protein
MKPIYDAWCVQIDITNCCFKSCLYCSRYNRHLRKDQRRHMTMEQFITALDSLKHWPTMIGIIGGEPLLHPQFVEFCEEIKMRFPKQKMGLWTSGPKSYQPNIKLITETFGFIAYNEHSQKQLNTCKHQPLTVAMNEVILDEDLRKQLIDDCWVQRTWCATINHFGAYFCEVAAAYDVLMNEGINAWPVTPDWWRKTPDQFQNEVGKFCHTCGMAIPMEREFIKNRVEKFTLELLLKFREHGLSRVTDADIQLYEHIFTKEEIKHNIKYWAPGNYRGDLYDDEVALEGRGFTKEII